MNNKNAYVQRYTQTVRECCCTGVRDYSWTMCGALWCARSPQGPSMRPSWFRATRRSWALRYTVPPSVATTLAASLQCMRSRPSCLAQQSGAPNSPSQVISLSVSSNGGGRRGCMADILRQRGSGGGAGLRCKKGSRCWCLCDIQETWLKRQHKDHKN